MAGAEPLPGPGNPPCHKFACAIQNCLQRSGYQEAKCKHLIYDLYQCCDKFYREGGEEARTVSCPEPNVLKLRMKQTQLGH